ncbi:uncharacterized protein C12orf29 homolog [Lingula anatina]|uniref:RNA ligase 1 n=1 Tax=Lingula anatina TaxID=7574 RepID=A0A1S3KE03_LINAN|nr:uncharacterized protein C12orf29 homolog [Lingula anatina]|eukprot:XP_013420727.1 uncharacterized protein C12orf29 homolog [Lingula anatina]
MLHLRSVQAKVPCIFKTIVIEEQSKKRSYQPYRVVASEELREDAVAAGVLDVLPSEKLDGTCVIVKQFREQPWLWARHDKKPTKATDRRFKKFQTIHRAWQASGKDGPQPSFSWNLQKDFKEVPENWEAAEGLEKEGDHYLPDSNGHIPGWVPVDPSLNAHVWHLSVLNLHKGLALVLQPAKEENGLLEITIRALSELQGQSLELIGTNVNGNPYGLGSKKDPFHLLVVHGSIVCSAPPELSHKALKSWFETQPPGRVEGLVWHCADGSLFKLHRHHVDLPWPVPELQLVSHPVLVNVDCVKYEIHEDLSLICKVGKLYGQTFSSIADVFKITKELSNGVDNTGQGDSR